MQYLYMIKRKSITSIREDLSQRRTILLYVIVKRTILSESPSFRINELIMQAVTYLRTSGIHVAALKEHL